MGTPNDRQVEGSKSISYPEHLCEFEHTRHGPCAPGGACRPPKRQRGRFPISASEDTYLHGPNAGRKAIKLLSKADQQTVRDLKPWKGGNGLLYALHQLDITRKHRRLVEVAIVPTLTRLCPWGRPGGIEFPTNWEGFKEVAMPRIRSDSPERLEVTFGNTNDIVGLNRY